MSIVLAVVALTLLGRELLAQDTTISESDLKVLKGIAIWGDNARTMQKFWAEDEAALSPYNGSRYSMIALPNGGIAVLQTTAGVLAIVDSSQRRIAVLDIQTTILDSIRVAALRGLRSVEVPNDSSAIWQQLLPAHAQWLSVKYNVIGL